MKGGAAMRLVVASRQAPRILREARTPDEAVAIVRAAVEGDPTLKAMGENRADGGEALELTERVMEAVRPRLLRVLARRSIRRSQQVQDAAFMDDLERDLRERGEIR